MRLIIECEHGEHIGHLYPCGCERQHRYIGCPTLRCDAQRTITDPDAILAALAEAGVLGRRRSYSARGRVWVEYSTQWKEAK